MSETVVAGVRLTHPDKILYPEQGITKGELADYYQSVSRWMLPHVARRPITMVRCPAGQEQKCFYQRHAGSGVPPQLKQVTVPGFDDPYLYIDDESGLIAMVQMGVLEMHPWGVTVEEPARPDRMIFDLDPSEGLGFEATIAAALEVRRRLESVGLRSFVKTTGGKGLHVVVPLDASAEWGAVKSFARAFSGAMARDDPERYLIRLSKAERLGRIFIDYLRNDPTSTAVGAYSTRARPGAPVATPLDWSELKAGLDPSGFGIATVPERLRRIGDPWKDIAKFRQALPSEELLSSPD